jgi:putative ABC transport system permease protein
MNESPVSANSTFDNRLAFRMAWRESRAAGGKFLFVILAVAMGVGTLTGVKGFSRAFHAVLLREARTLMAADLMVRVFALPAANQTAELDRLAREGVQRTWITETITMLSPENTDAPILISVKAVDPAVYPFYGHVVLSPPGTLTERLTPATIVVSRDLLLRLNADIGVHVRIGGQDFTVAGIVESEPDRMSGSLNVGPRVMMSRAALERTGLIIPGSRASERFLFRVPAAVSIDKVHTDLKKVFQESLITDFRQTNPTIQQGLERATVFLSLVSLIALIVGALGVAMAIDAHLQQKLDSIAIMKCIGARSTQIIRIYTIQTLGLGLCGGLLGIVAGFGVQATFPLLLARYFSTLPRLSIDFVSAIQGLGIGLLATLLFTLPPLLSIRRIRPGLILRRDVTTDTRTWREKWIDARPSAIAGAFILAGIGGIATWLSESLRTGVYFVIALAASLVFMAALGWLLLRGLRWFGRHLAWRLRPSLRHGIANLYRPGAHTQSALIALGIGVMFTLTVYLVQRGMLSEMRNNAPPGMPNVFLLDMTPLNRDGVMQLVARQKGLAEKPESVGTVSVKIAAINGVALDREKLKGIERHYASTVSGTESAGRPAYTKVVAGAFWDKDHPAAEPEVSVSNEAAKVMHLVPGQHLKWSSPSRTFVTRIAAVHETEAIRLGSRVEFLFSPGALEGLPVIYYGTARIDPKLVPELQKALYTRFPTVTVVNMADLMAVVEEVVDQISLIVRFISAFAILAGAIILASSVAGTRIRRIREVVILKTLGATRRRIAEIFSIEFLILGTVSGLAGSLLATAFSMLLLSRLFASEVRFDIVPNALAVVLTAVVANVAGWLASLRILNQRPLEILREQ